MNTNRCPFEKTILSTRFGCDLAQQAQLGDISAITCRSHTAWLNCNTVIGLLQEKSVFVFKLRKLAQPLPFGHKMKVLYGGLLGIKQCLPAQLKDELTVMNIHSLINQAKDHYGAFENLPFQDIIKSIASYQQKRN